MRYRVCVMFLLLTATQAWSVPPSADDDFEHLPGHDIRITAMHGSGVKIQIFRTVGGNYHTKPRVVGPPEYQRDLSGGYLDMGWVRDKSNWFGLDYYYTNQFVFAAMMNIWLGMDGRTREYIIFAVSRSGKPVVVFDAHCDNDEGRGLEVVHLDNDLAPELIVVPEYIFHYPKDQFKSGWYDYAHMRAQVWKWSPFKFRYVMVRESSYYRRLKPLRLSHFK